MENNKQIKNKNLLKKILIIIVFLSTYLMFFLLGKISNELTLGDKEVLNNNNGTTSNTNNNNGTTSNTGNNNGTQGNTSTNNGSSTSNNNQNQNQNQTESNTSKPNENNNSTNDPSTSKPSTEEDIVIDEAITLMENSTTDWTQLKELSIFKNAFYTKEYSNKIAPGFYGTYNFAIENKSNEPLNYILSFREENPQKVNMVYKLIKEGEYVLGNNTQNVYIDNVKLEVVTIPAKSKILYSLEWKWEDTENDTEIGKLGNVQYKLTLGLQAEKATN